MACCGVRPQPSTPCSVLAVKWMMRAPPGLPPLITIGPRLPSAFFSNTSVGDIDERGRLPGCTRLAMGWPCASAGAKLKSVSSLFSRKPLTIWRAPNWSSMVVVMASALPRPSTMLMWLVPYSGCGAIGAKLVLAPPGLPGWATLRLCAPISLARSAR